MLIWKISLKMITGFTFVSVSIFSTAVSSLADPAPYPQSPIIGNLTWAPQSTIIRKAAGSDNWPVTWADDDHLYGGYGDGKGFIPNVPSKLSLGFSKIIGDPSSFTGLNIRSSTGEQTGNGNSGKKASGILMIDGVLYMMVRNANLAGEHCQLAYSSDHAVTWTWTSLIFTEFGYCTFLNFGKNYAGARDGFVYIYTHDNPSAYSASDQMILMRVPKTAITNRSAYEFFKNLGVGGNPIWTSDIGQRGAVFNHVSSGGSPRAARSGVSYNAPLGRYLWWQQVFNGTVDTRFSGGFGIYDAPEPWGPWTTVYFTEAWDVGPGDSASFPPKWMSSDGKTLHLVFAGDDSLSVRKATLTLSDSTPPTIPSNLLTNPLDDTRINLDWSDASDPDSGIRRYRIYRNGLFIGNSNTTSYSDINLVENTIYTYEVSAVNGAGVEWPKSLLTSSSTFAETVAPPTIVWASVLGDPTRLVVIFSEAVDEISATNTANYSTDNVIDITSISLEADLKTLILTTSSHVEGATYSLTVDNVSRSGPHYLDSSLRSYFPRHQATCGSLMD